MDKIVTDPYAKKVLLLGFPAVQKTIINTLLTLSKRREVYYQAIESSDIFDCDILLLDVHDDVVLENWDQLKDIVGDMPVLAIGENEVPGATNWLKSAVLASSLLDTLDEMVRKAATGRDDLAPAATGRASAQKQTATSLESSVAVVIPENRISEKTPAAQQPPKDPLTTPSVEPTRAPKSRQPPGLRASTPVSATDVPPNTDVSAPVRESDAIPPARIQTPQQPQAAPSVTRTKLPAKPQEPASPAQPGANTGASGKQWPVQIVDNAARQHDSRILVVDDSLSVWTQMKICLEHISADVDYVSTAEDGLQIAERRAYNLIFMDVMLPGRDGYDACKAIKTHDYLKGTPVVMLTSKSAPANKVRGVLSGCNYYLTKPIDELELKAIVDRFMIVSEPSSS